MQTAKKGRRAPKQHENNQRSVTGDETEEVNIEGLDFGRSSMKNVCLVLCVFIAKEIISISNSPEFIYDML